MTHRQYLHLLHQISQLHGQADGNFVKLVLLITFDCVAIIFCSAAMLSTKR